MRTDEFFKAFTEIDDDLIANAKPMAQKPIVLKPERRSPWKMFAAAAACLAVIAAVGIFAANFDKIRGLVREIPDLSELSTSSSSKSAAFPEIAKYQYNGDFSELKLACYAIADRLTYNTYDELMENSELVVLGTFADNARQDSPTDSRRGEPPLGHAGFSSYNRLRIDKVFKGDAAAGDEVIICDSYYVNGGELRYVGSASLTPMIEGEQWVYFLKKSDTEFGEYYYVTGCLDGRFPVPGNENSFVLTDNSYGVYEEIEFNKKTYEDVKLMLSGITYKGKTYYYANSKTFGDGVKLSVWLTKPEYEVGENVEVLAIVKNGSDKPIGMLTPTQGGDYRDEFHYNISLGNEKLQKVFMGDYNGIIGIDCAMGSTVLQPGETFSHVQWFDTQKETFNSEGSIKPWYKPLGDYAGSVGIGLLEEPNNTSSKPTELTVDFSVRLVQRENLDDRGNFFKEFTMNEFPNVEFTCTENSVSVTENGKNTVLFDGVEIDTLYLYDLNGDGKRELCSSAHFGSGIVDYRIMVYDFADRKLYRLSDRGYYDYHLVSVLGYGDSYNLYFEKFKYSSPYQILNDVLTLDKMAEIENRQPDTRELIKGVTEIIRSPEEIGAGKSFTMEEFPGTTFYITEKSIKAVSDKLSKRNMTAITDKGFEALLCDDTIESVYLYDLNADGRREIVIVCEYVWSTHSYDSPKRIIRFLDYENSDGESLYCMRNLDEPNYYSLAVENGEMYISAGGEVLREPVTFDKVRELKYFG